MEALTRTYTTVKLCDDIQAGFRHIEEANLHKRTPFHQQLPFKLHARQQRHPESLLAAIVIKMQDFPRVVTFQVSALYEHSMYDFYMELFQDGELIHRHHRVLVAELEQEGALYQAEGYHRIFSLSVWKSIVEHRPASGSSTCGYTVYCVLSDTFPGLRTADEDELIASARASKLCPCAHEELQHKHESDPGSAQSHVENEIESMDEQHGMLSDLHGVNHPLVTISFKSPSIVCHGFNNSKMVVKFNLLGAVPGFRYRLFVQELAPGAGNLIRQHKTLLVVISNTSANEVAIPLAVFDARQDMFHLIIVVWDALEGLSSQDAYLAYKELVAPFLCARIDVKGLDGPGSLMTLIAGPPSIESSHSPNERGGGGSEHISAGHDSLLCVLIPFRDGCGWHSKNRSTQLDEFLDYMKRWLIDRGHTNFLFVVSEQSQAGSFNKGLVYNIGALEAFRCGCKYLVCVCVCACMCVYVCIHTHIHTHTHTHTHTQVFHDVDQFPVNPSNDYFYQGAPTHMCTWSTQFGTNIYACTHKHTHTGNIGARRYGVKYMINIRIHVYICYICKFMYTYIHMCMHN